MRYLMTYYTVVISAEYSCGIGSKIYLFTYFTLKIFYQYSLSLAQCDFTKFTCNTHYTSTVILTVIARTKSIITNY